MAATIEIVQPQRKYSMNVGLSKTENSATWSYAFPPALILTLPSKSSFMVVIHAAVSL